MKGMTMKLSKGLLHYYYGMGCGKTSLAIGHVIRAVGHQLNPVVLQFLKKHDPAGKKGYFSGEFVILTEKLQIPFFQYGDFGFVRTEKQIQENKKYAAEGMAKIKELVKNPEIDLIILDEIGSMLALGLIEENKLIDLLKTRLPHIEIIMTGHNLYERLKEEVDYLISLQDDKHPFKQGIQARKGIEY